MGKYRYQSDARRSRVIEHQISRDRIRDVHVYFTVFQCIVVHRKVLGYCFALPLSFYALGKSALCRRLISSFIEPFFSCCIGEIRVFISVVEDFPMHPYIV